MNQSCYLVLHSPDLISAPFWLVDEFTPHEASLSHRLVPAMVEVCKSLVLASWFHSPSSFQPYAMATASVMA
jgi:hypothetical protein